MSRLGQLTLAWWGLSAPAVVHAWMSVEAEALGVQSARELAQTRWIHLTEDEHRRLTLEALEYGGLPAALAQDFSLRMFVNRATREPADAAAVDLIREETRSFAEFAQLPDYGFGLYDWASAFSSCPPEGRSGDGEVCHRYEGHIGMLNANHFLPQAERFYSYYHQLALTRAEACAELAAQLPEDRDDVYVLECEQEAMILEAVAQHYLQDAWSSGHMWERFGSPRWDDFPSDERLLRGLAVAATAGLIHGAEAKFRWSPDGLCYPDEDVQMTAGPFEAGEFARSLGDLHAAELNAPEYSQQQRALLRCASESLRHVYERTAQRHGPLGSSAAAPLSEAQLRGPTCFGQRVTNRALRAGFGLALPNGLAADIPPWIAAKVVLAATDEDRQLALALQAAGCVLTAGQIGTCTLPLSVLEASFRQDLTRLSSYLSRRATLEPDGIDASKTLPNLLGVERNGAYLDRLPEARPVDYVDPPLPWSASHVGSGLAPELALTRTFHRAHVREWCAVTTLDDLKEMRAQARRARDFVANDALRTMCREFVSRHIEPVPYPGRCRPPREDAEPVCARVAPESLHIYWETTSLDSVAAAEEWCLSTDDGALEPPEQTPDSPECAKPVGDGGAFSITDPHVRTLDGLDYDFHAQGEFILARSTVDDFEVQVRQETLDPAGMCAVTVNSVVAVRYGGHIVRFARARTKAFIDGEPVPSLDTEQSVALGDSGAVLSGAAAKWLLGLPDGTTLRVDLGKLWINVRLLPAKARASTFEGLLGNYDGDARNDLVERGAVTSGGTDVTHAWLYGAFAQSWRVDASTSLFEYGVGEGPETYYDPSYPLYREVPETLAPELLAEADDACTGVVEPARRMCQLDMACLLRWLEDLASLDLPNLRTVYAGISPPVATLSVRDAPVAPDEARPPPKLTKAMCHTYCESDEDCFVNGVRMYQACDTSRGICVDWLGLPTECTTDADCHPIYRSGRACDQSSSCGAYNVCVTHVSAGPLTYPLCAPLASQARCTTTTRATTVEGTETEICASGPAPSCDPTTSRCSYCTRDDQCPSDAPYCVSGECRTCNQAGECLPCQGSSRCRCDDHADCIGRGGYCGSDGLCTCVSDQACSTDVLNPRPDSGRAVCGPR